jgi:lipopolysaccharide export system protein LptA
MTNPPHRRPTDMKAIRFILLPALAWVASAHGQGASRLNLPNTGGDSKKQLQEAAERLRQAQNSGELEQARTKARELIKNLPPGVSDAAKAAVQSPEKRQQALEAAKAAVGSMAPQVQGLLNGGQAAGGSSAAPSAASTPKVDEQPPAAPSGPVPGALQPLGTASTDSARGIPNVIIEADRSDFDLNNAVFIYSGHVKARHPDFYIECEELEVHMIKEEEGKSKKEGGKPSVASRQDPIISPGAGKAKKEDKAPPIRKAIARGPMVIIEKRSLEGDAQQGRCKRLEYDGTTRNITLSDYPQVQKGNVLHIATTADTTMVFDKEGRLSTNGRPRTVILSDDQPPQKPSSGSN